MKSISELRTHVEVRRKKLNDAKLHIAGQLRALGAQKIVLFGSVATNTITNSSDLDLLVVMPLGKTGWQWTNEIYEKVERKVSADIVAYNLDEFEKMKEESSFVKYALMTGIEL